MKSYDDEEESNEDKDLTDGESSDTCTCGHDVTNVRA